jgi:Tfp pilus assembly protein PilN
MCEWLTEPQSEYCKNKQRNRATDMEFIKIISVLGVMWLLLWLTIRSQTQKQKIREQQHQIDDLKRELEKMKQKQREIKHARQDTNF